jgi:hypothetical protein
MPSSEEQQRPSAADPSSPEPATPDTPLGHIEAGPRDSELGAQPPATSHRKGAQPPATTESPTGQPSPPDQDPLRLPRGGLVAMRQSGGLLFRSREIVIYRSGKLVYRQLAPAGAEPASHTRQVALADLVELHHWLKGIDFSKLPDAGRQNPDTFAYEIVARVGRAMKFAEAVEGSIPAALAPLISELRRLMP